MKDLFDILSASDQKATIRLRSDVQPQDRFRRPARHVDRRPVPMFRVPYGDAGFHNEDLDGCFQASVFAHPTYEVQPFLESRWDNLCDEPQKERKVLDQPLTRTARRPAKPVHTRASQRYCVRCGRSFDEGVGVYCGLDCHDNEVEASRRQTVELARKAASGGVRGIHSPEFLTKMMDAATKSLIGIDAKKPLPYELREAFTQIRQTVNWYTKWGQGEAVGHIVKELDYLDRNRMVQR